MVSGYKKTEIGDVPSNWDVRLLGEISTPKARIGWQNLRKDEYLDSGVYMLITGTDFSNGRIDYATCKYVSEERYNQDTNIQVGNGDILITKDGTLGKVALVTGLKTPATLNAGVFVLNNLSSSVNNEFLYHYLSTNRLMKFAERTSTGGTIQHLNQSVLISFPIPVPPLDEQIKIAKALTDTDSLIIQEEQLVTKYQSMKQGCLQHMFPRKGQSEPEMRLPGFSDAWEQRKLGDLVTIERGGSPRPIDAYITNAQDGLNWVKIGDAPEQGRSLTHTEEPIKPSGLSKTRQVFPGDLILSNSMSFGKPYIMDISGCIHDGWLLIRNNQNVFDLKFLCQMLGTEQMLAQYRQLAAGSTVNNLNKELVSNAVVKVPKKAEQEQIGAFLENLDNVITLHQRECEKYKLIKQGMMEDLLTGKKRLK